MSTFAVFESGTNRNLGEGKTEEEAYNKACDTLATAGSTTDRVSASMVEWDGSDMISHQVVLLPQWNGSHVTGQS